MQQNSELNAMGLVDRLLASTWNPQPPDTRLAAISRVVRQSLTEHLMTLADHPEASIGARAASEYGLARIRQRIDVALASGNGDERIFAGMMNAELKRFDERPHGTAREPARQVSPPGSPIGGS